MKINKYSFLLVAFFLFASNSFFAQNDFNKLDEKGKKHGLWKGNFEESKRPRYEGTFHQGKDNYCNKNFF